MFTLVDHFVYSGAGSVLAIKSSCPDCLVISCLTIKMKRRYTEQEALQVIMEPESELQEYSDSETESATSIEEGEGDIVLESSSSTSSVFSTSENEDITDPAPDSEWIGISGKVWSSSNAETSALEVENLKQKPVIIKDYNRCKGGVDNLDKVCSFSIIHIKCKLYLFMMRKNFVLIFFSLLVVGYRHL